MNNRGAIALTTLIFIVALLLGFGITLILTSIDLSRASLGFENYLLAQVQARTCLEEALYNIRKDDGNYRGMLTINYPNGTCEADVDEYNATYLEVEIVSTVNDYTYNETRYVNISIEPYDLVTVLN